MLAQKQGIDFRKCIDEKKILLIKLSQGLIGEDNSYLLGSLFLSKFNQVAQSRQNLPKNERHPYYIYCDEFQNFITPSISQILSGARKYGLGLILAHQETAQIDDYKTLNSVISNPYIRICFRLGDIDSKKLESGFSYFEQNDLQSLQVGQAIVRIGSSTKDFNLATSLLKEVTTDYSEYIISHVRKNYATPRKEVENILTTLLPNIRRSKEEVKIFKKEEPKTLQLKEPKVIEIEAKLESSFEEQKEAILQVAEKEEKERKHRTIQNYIKTVASQRGYKTTIEKELVDGKRIDVVIEKDKCSIAFEISVTNSIDYEIKNIQKCLQQNYQYICCVCDNKTHLGNIQKRLQETIDTSTMKTIRFFNPSEIIPFLDSFTEKEKPKTKRVRGYRVKSKSIDISGIDADEKNQTLKSILLKEIRKKSSKK